MRLYIFFKSVVAFEVQFEHTARSISSLCALLTGALSGGATHVRIMYALI